MVPDEVVVVAPTREEEPPAWRERDMMMIINIIKTGRRRRRRDGMVENKVTWGIYSYALAWCWYGGGGRDAVQRSSIDLVE